MFTPAQLDTIAKTLAALPTILNQNNLSLTELGKVKDNYWDTDQVNSVFMNQYLNYMQSYYDELKEYLGTSYTNFDTSGIDPSARQVDNSKHYPNSPTVWTNLLPKLTDDVNGLPFSTDPLYLREEVFANSLVGTYIGATATSETATSTTTNISITTTTLFAVNVGDILGFSNTILGEHSAVRVDSIISASATSTVISYTLIAGTLPAGGAIQVGLLNDQYDALVDSYLDFLSNLQSIISSNGDPEGTVQNSAASFNISSFEANLNLWRLSTTRFNAVEITNLESLVPGRLTQITSRVSGVTTLLGFISQATDGTVTGSGVRNNLWNWVVSRISKAGGSLLGYYTADLGIEFVTLQRDNNLFLQSQYSLEVTFVTLVTDLVISGDFEIGLVDASSVVIGNSYTISDDSGNSETISVVAKVGNTITVSTPLLHGYDPSLFAKIFS